ncbi:MULTISPECIES: hypothetical protein [unclassified Streptomyces]|uniref:hypothetical protein n=1 Tax=unclassified Streptomyces TaxID=2593676 RepID=UPI002E2A86AE|nr:hypothetical protein [Streptomyces sp. NBC_01423]WSX91027.1 hypothetical protein OH827_10975 [Streptomyces sp. NBC_00891]WSY05505.1 hypothetical protein OG464_10975 [Streptomyces sp. NBC_00890]WSZ07129.1 hypothetical protein OG704_10975 [Streptomyces sp. NBC_00869]WSZ25372.1 hypothetical protein OG498_22590 [Streptomyces sp. NBC_00870]
MVNSTDGIARLGPDDLAQRLRAEIVRMRDEATRQRKLAHRRAEFWARTDIALGLPAALLAGTAGAAGLASADVRVAAALAALASAGFAAGAGFLRSDTRRRANKRARQAWASVEARAMVALAREHVSHANLDDLLECRQAALAAYDGEDAGPGTAAGAG